MANGTDRSERRQQEERRGEGGGQFFPKWPCRYCYANIDSKRITRKKQKKKKTKEERQNKNKASRCGNKKKDAQTSNGVPDGTTKQRERERERKRRTRRMQSHVRSL